MSRLIVINGITYVGTVTIWSDPEPQLLPNSKPPICKPEVAQVEISIEDNFKHENLKRIQQLEQALKSFKVRYPRSPWIHRIVDEVLENGS